MRREEYLKARKAGQKYVQRNNKKADNPFLPCLNNMLSHDQMKSEEPIGVKEIPLSRVIGTVTEGRKEAFAGNYMPLLEIDTEFAAKWMNVLEFQMNEGINDPIKVKEYKGSFYVLEGNKRVSVLKYLNQPMIDADIIRIHTVDGDERYQQFLTFYRCTGLYEPWFSKAESYELLAEKMGMSLNCVWPQQSIQKLRSCYHQFVMLYDHQSKDTSRMEAGDAFLLYLNVFSLDSLLSMTDKEIQKNLEKIWLEYEKKAETAIVYQESPKSQSGMDRITQTILKPVRLMTESPMRILFIYDRDPNTSRWLHSHEIGRLELVRIFGQSVITDYVICEDFSAFDEAVLQAVNNHTKIIITPSAGQMEDTLRNALKYPKIKFYNCSINQNYKSVHCYYGRMYEIKFLMGVLAGLLTNTNRIGYVSDYPFYGTVAAINAFAIGVAMVNPEAKVELVWSCIKDEDWKETMENKQVDFVCGPDSIMPQTIDQEFGLFRIDVQSKESYAIPLWDWGRYYELIIKNEMEAVLSMDKQVENAWYGLSSGVIDLILSHRVPYSIKNMIQLLKNAVTSGSVSVFDGQLYSQSGIIQSLAGVRMSNKEIVQMDWLNENIEGTFPNYEQLTDSARKAIQINKISGES
ncbi:MAG: BMP family ABC transporter substrate-binding protein [Faecalicoccus sp.]|nr:BMP family ABC transporter substrate-binding protein [Faecalicoccus sp.]